MHVYMYTIYMYIYIYAYTPIYLYICTYVHIYIYIYIYIHRNIDVSVHTDIYIYTYKYKGIYTYKAYIYTRVYVEAYTCMEMKAQYLGTGASCGDRIQRTCSAGPLEAKGLGQTGDIQKATTCTSHVST